MNPILRLYGKQCRILIRWLCKAYPGSVFVVANTVAKWKKLEPNETNFSQGSARNSIFFVVCLSLQTVSLDPDQARQNVGPDQDSNCLTP